MRCASGQAALLGLLALAGPARLAAAPATTHQTRFTDVSYQDAVDLSAALRAGAARIDLPFGFVWDGVRYTAAEAGPGWLRLIAPGEVASASGLSARPVSARDPGESAPARPAPLFAPIPGDLRLPASARVLLARDAARVALRFRGLLAPGATQPLALEILLDRFGQVRYQYLQVQGLGDPALRNGLALEVQPPGRMLLAERHDGATGPPPPGCAAPAGTWCDRADGPAADTTILLDAHFEESPQKFTTDGRWNIIDAATCAPGAIAGNSAYVGDPAACSYSGAFQNSIFSPAIGPITASTRLIFSARHQWVDPTDLGEILVNGTPVWKVNPNPTDPASWYLYNPLTFPAPFLGQMVTVQFRFTSSGTLSGQLGWMVDDVFVWEDNGANYNCARGAIYDRGEPTFAECSDTVHTDWAFNEIEYCQDCTYSFYALVECGTEMHLPLADMEGAEVTITEIVSGLRPSLTCQNDASRAAPGPVVLQADCCSTVPGDERWYGPVWSATDSNGPGSVAWGFPDCPDLVAAYDTNGDGLSCTELTPSCGGVLTRLSPGERQGMDCRIAGSPGLCGIYRIDVRSGGFVWNLFANCTGDTTPGFQLFASCADAWAAFNPLPELAVTAVAEVGTCPNTELDVTLANVGCADQTGAIELRVVSNCTPPDTASFTLTGGLAANRTRTDRLPMTVSCPAATVTVTVDPNALVAECSETGSAAACKTIPGADSASLAVCACAGTALPTPAASTVCAGQATRLSCGTPGAGTTYEWDFTDDGSYDATGCDVLHSYPGPGSYTARLRQRTSQGCTTDATVTFSVIADDPAAEPVLLLGARRPPAGLRFEWQAVAKAASYRVARGTLRNFWDHTVDDASGIGMCDTAGALFFDDPDDLADPGGYYYLAAPLSNCGTAAPWGNGLDAVPPPLPSASCP